MVSVRFNIGLTAVGRPGPGRGVKPGVWRNRGGVKAAVAAGTTVRVSPGGTATTHLNSATGIIPADDLALRARFLHESEATGELEQPGITPSTAWDTLMPADPRCSRRLGQ
jgi:hypothetical protein